MGIQDAMETKEQYQEYYDRREAKLKKLGLVMEQWGPKENDAHTEEVEDYYAEVGRLKGRLEANQHKLDELRETGNWEELREDVDQAISDLEEAISKAAPRFQ